VFNGHILDCPPSKTVKPIYSAELDKVANKKEYEGSEI
jgi:hypothetical protein